MATESAAGDDATGEGSAAFCREWKWKEGKKGLKSARENESSIRTKEEKKERKRRFELLNVE